jgi:drug/metabolite transporter (DMT)-like permease
LGLGAAALAPIGWGFGAVFATLTSASGLLVSFYRLWVGAAVFVVAVYVSRRRLSWDGFRGSWLGGVFLAGDIALFFCALKLTSVVDVTVIGAVQPALVLIVARPLFGERMGKWEVFWILVAMAGVSAAVIAPGVSSRHQLTGDLLAVGSTLSWTAYWLVSKHSRTTQNALEYTAIVTIVAAIALTPVMLLSGQSLVRVEAGDWLWISLLAIVPGAANLSMNWAHRYVDASVSSVIGASNPIVAAAAAAVIVGQRVTALQVGCGLVGIIAITIVAARHRQPIESALD